MDSTLMHTNKGLGKAYGRQGKAQILLSFNIVDHCNDCHSAYMSESSIYIWMKARLK